MTDHCPACQVARQLGEHRDATAPEWSVRRATLSFAVIVARRACPGYVAAEATGEDEDHTLAAVVAAGDERGAGE